MHAVTCHVCVLGIAIFVCLSLADVIVFVIEEKTPDSPSKSVKKNKIKERTANS